MKFNLGINNFNLNKYDKGEMYFIKTGNTVFLIALRDIDRDTTDGSPK